MSLDLEILAMEVGMNVVLTFLSVLAVAFIAVVYTVLIRCGRFMSTTAKFPIKPIEKDIGNLLSSAWPESTEFPSSNKFDSVFVGNEEDRESSLHDAIKLFYLGKMTADRVAARVAKGVCQSSTLPLGPGFNSKLWLTSGSPTTKCTVQLLVWEWVSLWLVIIMVPSILAYNGFFTNQLSLDSYPRLVITLIYTVSFCIHFYYVWRVALKFLTKVAAACSWSLIERANFAVAETEKLNAHLPGHSFDFRSIDKASEEHIPKTFSAYFKHETGLIRTDTDETVVEKPELERGAGGDEYLKDLTAAHKTMLATQVTERDIARMAANDALSRVIGNAMIMMSITLSCGFCSWTTRQATENTPNNFAAAQIGSLALLGSLSVGAGLMFSSALNLSTMESSFHTIFSLRELRINGKAVDHYKKRRSQYKSVGFLDGRIPLAAVRFWDILVANKRRYFLGMLFLGPALGLLPTRTDYERRSEAAEFDIRVRVRQHFVLFTTRETKAHLRDDRDNAEVIKVCYVG